MSKPKVVFEPVPSRYRVENRIRGGKWVDDQCFPTLEAATVYAQKWLDNDPNGYEYRVVDTKPSGAQPVYTVEALRGDNGSWYQITPATSSSEAYAYAKQCAEEARSAGENNLKYRVVQTDADGAKIAQIVTPDGLGDLNPLNLLWIEKMEREDTTRATDTAVDTQPDAVRVGDETPLTLDQYQEQAKATAIYPYEKSDQYLIAGLAGEVGELASIFAKVWRGDGNLKFPHAAAELGDVLWFVAMLAKELGYDLSDVAQNNLNKLADRANRGKLKGNGDNR